MRAFLLLAALAAQDLRTARESLLSAVEKLHEEGAADAAQAIKQAGGREAVQALAKGFEAASKSAARVEAEIERLQAGLPEKGKPSAEYKVSMKELTGKLVALQGIRLSIGQAVAGVRGEVVDDLIQRLKGSEEGGFRAWVATALASSQKVEALAALVERLEREPDPRVLVAVLDALAAKQVKDPAVVSGIVARLKDPLWTVAVSAASALARLGVIDAVEPLIDALGASEGRVRADLNAALGKLTGVDKHGDPAAWKDWWGRNREAVLAGTYKPEPAERAGGAAGGTTFYGLPVVSKRPVFVIDASMSMKQPSQWKPADDAPAPAGLKLAGERKIDVAQYELKKVIAMLPDGAEFNVVFFHRDVDVFSPFMARLDKDSRAKAFAWIDGLELVFQTNIYEGLKRAFSFTRSGIAKSGPRDTVASGADTIYLLTDGQPTTGIKDVDEFCRAVAEMNRLRKIVIHTVAIEPTLKGGKFLQRLASENGGQSASRGEKKKP